MFSLRGQASTFSTIFPPFKIFLGLVLKTGALKELQCWVLSCISTDYAYVKSVRHNLAVSYPCYVYNYLW
jgi:hypothetical protein